MSAPRTFFDWLLIAEAGAAVKRAKRRVQKLGSRKL